MRDAAAPRRCQLLAADDGAKATIAAVIVNDGGSERRAVLAGLALALHAGRSPSPASELEAIEEVLTTDRADAQANTVNTSAAQTGMSAQTIRRRLRLRRHSPILRDAFATGKLTTSVAEAAARLSERQQAQLEQTLADGRHVTLGALRQITRERTTQSALELPDGLFSDAPAPWQVTACGHLQAALDAIPAVERHTPLAETIKDALSQAQPASADGQTGSEESLPRRSAEGDRRLLDQLGHAEAHLHREGCSDAAAAVREAIRRLTPDSTR